MPPADALPMPIYTPAAVGTVGFVPDPVHSMGPRVIPLVVKVELFNVREAEAFPLTCILKVIVCRVVNKAPCVGFRQFCKIHILVGVRAFINTTCGV